MTVDHARRASRPAAWGWGILSTLCVLMIANAAWLYASVGTDAAVESDTGVSLIELRTAFPEVADELAARGRTIALLLGGLAALALAVTISGMRTGAPWARTSLWVMVAALVAVATNAFAGGRAEIGSLYLALALLSGVGLLLVARGEGGRSLPVR